MLPNFETLGIKNVENKIIKISKAVKYNEIVFSKALVTFKLNKKVDESSSNLKI